MKVHITLAVLLTAILSTHVAVGDEAAASVSLRALQGRPTVVQDGKPVLMAAYCNSIVGWGSPESEARWKSWVDYFIKSGVKVFHLELGRYKAGWGQSNFWMDENIYPKDAPQNEPLSTDKQAAYILSKVPDARFIIRLHAHAPKAWMDKNPDELQTDSAGKKYEPSWASEKYLDGLQLFLRRVVTHYESQAWSKHIIGYMMIPYGEGLTILSFEGHFYDRSPAMRAAWRELLLQKYQTDEALKKAWRDKDASLDAVEVPDAKALRAKIGVLPHWPKASQMRVERDSALLQRAIFERYVADIATTMRGATGKRRVLIGMDAMKQPLLGWQIREFFDGSGLGPQSFSMFLSSGSKRKFGLNGRTTKL